MRYCPRCGRPVHPDAVFCGECGARIADYEVVDAEAGASSPGRSGGPGPGAAAGEGAPRPDTAGVIRPGAKVRVYKDPMIDEEELARALGANPNEEDSEIDLSRALESGQVDTVSDEDVPERKPWEDEDLEEALDDGNVVRREDLADEDGVEIICRMCGEEVHVARALLKHRPLKVKCRACGFEWMIR